MDLENSEDALNISKRKLEEDGYINDVASIVKRSRGGEEYLAPNLLHLSDDVLLFVLKNCPPRDLKALSFSCQRLKRLCGDRSLWVKADLRRRPIGEKALAGFVRKLRPITQALCVRGLVGRRNLNAEVKEPKPEPTKPKSGPSWVSHSDVEVSMHNMAGECDVFMTLKPVNCQQHSAPSTSACETPPAKENGNSSPKPYNSPSYSPKSSHGSSGDVDAANPDGSTGKEEGAGAETEPEGGGWTMTKKIMDDVVRRCPNMKEMRLEYCNIDCLTLAPMDCPGSLEILSLKGCVCYNIPINKSYLFNLHLYMKNLVELDLSCCDWLSSHSLLQLSKMEHLKKLSLRNCRGIGECVAYASLSARYGFKALEVLDIRGTLMGDSEVSSLTWIASLQELYLEPPSSERPLNSQSRPTTTWAISSGNWTITGGNYADFCGRHAGNPAGNASAATSKENVEPVPVPAWKKLPKSYLDENSVALDDQNDGGNMEEWELEVPFDETDDDEFLVCPPKEEFDDTDQQEGGAEADAREGCSHAAGGSSQSDQPTGSSGSGASDGSQPQRDGDAPPGDNRPRRSDQDESYTMRINGERFDNGLVQVIYVNVRRPRADVNAVIVAPELPLNAINIHNIRVQVDVGQGPVEFNDVLNQNGANQQANVAERDAVDVNNEQLNEPAVNEAEEFANNPDEPGVMHHIFINRQRHVMQEGRLVPENRDPPAEIPPVFGQIRRIYMNADRNNQNNRQNEVVVALRPENNAPNAEGGRANPVRVNWNPPRPVDNPNEPRRADRAGWYHRQDLVPGESFRNLRHLDNSELVTDDTLRRFAAVDIPCMNRATGLRVLVCRGYSGITDRGLMIMANSRTALRLLDISGTRVSAEARAAFRRRRPECKLIHEDDSDTED